MVYYILIPKTIEKSFTTNLVGSYLPIFLGTAIHKITTWDAQPTQVVQRLQLDEQRQRCKQWTRRKEVGISPANMMYLQDMGPFLLGIVYLFVFFKLWFQRVISAVKVWNKATVWWGEYTGMLWDSTPQRYNPMGTASKNPLFINVLVCFSLLKSLFTASSH